MRQDGDQATLAAAYGELGKVLHAYDLFEQAEACYHNAILLDDQSYQWFYLSGHCLVFLHRYQEAQQRFNRCVVLDPSAWSAYTQLGKIALGRGDLEAAQLHLTKALELQPQHLQALFTLGEVSIQAGAWQQAIDYLEQVHQRFSGVGAQQLGIAYRQLGQLENAHSFLQYEEVVMLPNADPLLFQIQSYNNVKSGLKLGRNLLEANQVKLARQSFARVLAEDPQNIQALMGLGSSWFAEKQDQQAQAYFLQVLRLDSEHSRANYYIGTIALRLQNVAMAINHLQQALAGNPDDASAHHNLALAYGRRGQMAKAADHMQQAIGLNSGEVASHYHNLRFLLQLGRWTEVGAQLELAVKAFPDSPQIQSTAIRVWSCAPTADLRHGERALAQAETLLAREESGVHYMLYAMALAETGQFAAALSNHNKGLALLPASQRTTKLTHTLQAYRRGQACRYLFPFESSISEPLAESD